MLNADNEKISKSKVDLIDDFGLLNNFELNSESKTINQYTCKRRSSMAISDF